MQKPLDELYDQYNRFIPGTKTQQEIEKCHQQLIRSLEKPGRKLVLRIIDNKDLIAGARARESFACGFWLAWRLFTQLHQYDSDRSLEKTIDGNGRFFMPMKKHSVRIANRRVSPAVRPVYDFETYMGQSPHRSFPKPLWARMHRSQQREISE